MTKKLNTTSTSPKSKKNKNKFISFDEFKAWLSGVEDLQSSDWHPSKEQWEIIREKINSIRINNVGNGHTQPQQGKFSQQNQQSPNTSTRQELPPMRFPQTSGIAQPEQTHTNTGSRHVVRLPSEFEGKSNPVDSSDGTYTSSFG